MFVLPNQRNTPDSRCSCDLRQFTKCWWVLETLLKIEVKEEFGIKRFLLVTSSVKASPTSFERTNSSSD